MMITLWLITSKSFAAFVFSMWCSRALSSFLSPARFLIETSVSTSRQSSSFFIGIVRTSTNFPSKLTSWCWSSPITVSTIRPTLRWPAIGLPLVCKAPHLQAGRLLRVAAEQKCGYFDCTCWLLAVLCNCLLHPGQLHFQITFSTLIRALDLLLMPPLHLLRRVIARPKVSPG